MTTLNRRESTRVARQPGARAAEYVGLAEIAVALARVVNVDAIDDSTLNRWITLGVRGHRLAARQVGRSWRCTHAAIEAFARAMGALPEAAHE